MKVAQNLVLGLVGMAGIWLSNGLTLPFINRLHEQATPEQLMAVRGGVTIYFLYVLGIWIPAQTFVIDGWLVVLAVSFALAALGLYRSIRLWGVARTVIIYTLTPVVNLAFARLAGKEIGITVVYCLAVLFLGVLLAMVKTGPDTVPSHRGALLSGFLWSTGGAICNGLYYEALPRTQVTTGVLLFWQALLVFLIGAVAGGGMRRQWFKDMPGETAVTLLIFAVIGGLGYFWANLLAFDNLPRVIASVLAQGEMPVVIAAAGLIANERLRARQWLGLFLILGSAGYLACWLAGSVL